MIRRPSFIAISALLLGSIAAERASARMFEKRPRVDLEDQLNALFGNRQSCGTESAERSVSCDYLTTSEIAALCKAETRQQASEPPKAVRQVRTFSCYQKGDQKFPHAARYDLGVTEEGLFKVTQKIFFSPSKVMTEDDKKKFAEQLDDSLDDIRAFYRKQGIDYQLEYTLDPKETASFKPHDTVLIDFSPKRTRFPKVPGRTTHTHSRAWTDDDRKGDTDDETRQVFAHELAHLLGFPDDYVDVDHPCIAQYGKTGRNGSRGAMLLCPEPDARKEKKYCSNVMQSSRALKEETFASDEFYKLLEPACPGVCTFKTARLNSLNLDYPSSMSGELAEAKSDHLLNLKAQQLAPELKAREMELVKKARSMQGTAVQEILAKMKAVEPGANLDLTDEDVADFLDELRQAKSWKGMPTSKLILKEIELNAGNIALLESIQDIENVKPDDPIRRKYEANSKTMRNLEHADPFGVSSWRYYWLLMKAVDEVAVPAK